MIKKELLKLLIFTVCVFILFNYIIKIGVVPTGSMEPTIKIGDITVNNCLAYVWNKPKRGDIIIFTGENQEYLCKRIIGLPGDVISFVDGYVVVNGSFLEEDYLNTDVESNNNDTFYVPEGHYFVMGDNRENSLDSRYFYEPYISEECICAKLIFVLKTSFFKVD